MCRQLKTSHSPFLTYQIVQRLFLFFFWAAFGRKDSPYKILGLFFLFSGVIKLFTLVTAIKSIHNLPAYHVLALLEIVCVYSFYRSLKREPIQWVVIMVFIILYTSNIIIQPITTTFNSNTWTLTVVLILALGFYYFYDLYQNIDDTIRLERRPDFITTVGWMVYAAGSLFTYLMATDILSGSPDGFFKNAWIFQCISNIFKNAIISYAFLLTRHACHKKVI